LTNQKNSSTYRNENQNANGDQQDSRTDSFGSAQILVIPTVRQREKKDEKK